jgi:hypothetical protein
MKERIVTCNTLNSKDKKYTVSRTITVNDKPVTLVLYPIISTTITDKFLKNYNDITGHSVPFQLPCWFFFEGPLGRPDIPEEFEINCLGIIGPSMYAKMKQLYHDMKTYNSNEVLKSPARAKEIYNKIYNCSYWSSL